MQNTDNFNDMVANAIDCQIRQSRECQFPGFPVYGLFFRCAETALISKCLHVSERPHCGRCPVCHLPECSRRFELNRRQLAASSESASGGIPLVDQSGEV